MTIPRRVRRGIKEPKGIGLFDLIVTGAGWTPARKHQAGYNHDGKCPFCGEQGADTLHQVWKCPKVLERLGPEREETQHLEELPFLSGLSDQETWSNWQKGTPTRNGGILGQGNPTKA